MKKLIASFAVVFLLTAEILAADKTPPPRVLGVKIGMKEEAVREFLRKIGKQHKEEKKEEEEEEGGEEEIWTLTNDKNYESLIVGFDRKHLVRYVSVFAGKNSSGKVLYGDIGDVKKARVESTGNNYRYTWDVAAKGKMPHYLVIARGTNSQNLSSLSIKRID